MPVPWMALHDALAGQSTLAPVTASLAPGLQISAQLEGVFEGGISSTHFGWAVAPAGAAGQGAVALHAGEQNFPATPVMETAFSLVEHAPAFGSSYCGEPGGAGGAGGEGPGGVGGAGGPDVMVNVVFFMS